MAVRHLAWVLAAAAIACTPTHRGPVEEPTLDLGLMYWAPPLYILGGNYGLIFTARVHDTGLVAERVLHQGPVPSADGPVPMLRAGHTVTTNAAEGLAVGDRVLVFATSYEGGYAIAPARGTTTPMGVALSAFDDPIVRSTERWLSGAPDFPNADDAEAWRPYGESALTCFRNNVPVSHCDSYVAELDGRTQP